MAGARSSPRWHQWRCGGSVTCEGGAQSAFIAEHLVVDAFRARQGSGGRSMGRSMGGGGGDDVRVRGQGTTATSLVGQHRSVHSARGRAARGDGALGTEVSAGLRDRRLQECTGIRARWVGGRADAARCACATSCVGASLRGARSV
jgi:hypothetical protein